MEQMRLELTSERMLGHGVVLAGYFPRDDFDAHLWSGNNICCEVYF